jgi:hypothetical protein
MPVAKLFVAKRNKSLHSTNIGLLIVLCIIASFFSECKKYPDGPDFSFRSKSSRISATWYIDVYLVNGTDQTTAYTNIVGGLYMLTIQKTGSYQVDGNLPDEGACQFGDKHKNFYMQSSLSGLTTEYSILRLEYKSMWLKHIKSNGDVEEFHYKAYR